MNLFKRFATVATLGAVGTASWYIGDTLVKDVKFAHAREDVAVAREQLQKVDDTASVYKSIGKAIEPSVVFIEVTKNVHGAKNSRDIRKTLPFDDDTLKRFFPDQDGDGEPDLPQEQGDSLQVGQGSGVIMETSGSTGWILTNNHVAGNADEIKITLQDGREIKNAKVLGADPKTDLAVVQIQADHLIPAAWGDSAKLEKGDIVMAFGAPFGYVGSMTHGIVSALNRQAGILGTAGYENFIQVDCPINPGNSGGPLVDTRGSVVGINTAILSRNGGFQGIGFAIPSNQARYVYGQLKESGKVTRGWLGVSISELSAQPGLAESFGFTGSKGVVVNQVMPGPAEGKLHDGDIVTAINGQKTDNMQELRNTVATIKPGTSVELDVFRDGKAENVKLAIGEQPENVTFASGRNLNKPGKTDGGSVDQKLGLRLVDPNKEMIERYGLDSDESGAIVASVARDSVAFRKGIRQGDLITKIDGTDIASADDAQAALADKSLGKGVRLQITSREGKRFVFLRGE